MKLAAIQMVSTPDLERNLQAAARLIDQAARAGANLLCLPEYFCLMGRRDVDKLELAEAQGQGPIQTFLAAQAREHRVWLVGGTLPLSVPGRSDRVHNSCLVFGPDGERAARYDKIHLFSFERGAERYDEGRVLEPGDVPVTFMAMGRRVGLSVCYDLRFPELYRSLAGPPGEASWPCDLVCVPSAFTWTTGRSHWEVLLRARAVENQCYVLASAQGGEHENGRRTWGHSMIVDPWGEVVARVEEGEGIALADLDGLRLNEVRAQLPALKHRKAFLIPASDR